MIFHPRYLIEFIRGKVDPADFNIGDVPAWDGHKFTPGPGGGGGGITKKRLVLSINDPLPIGGNDPSSGTIAFTGLSVNEMGDDMVFFDNTLTQQADRPWTYGQILSSGLYSFHFSWVGQGPLGSNVTYGGLKTTLVVPGDPTDPTLSGGNEFLRPDSHPNLAPSGNAHSMPWIVGAAAPYPADPNGIFAVQYSFDADGDAPGGTMLLLAAQLTVIRLA